MILTHLCKLCMSILLVGHFVQVLGTSAELKSAKSDQGMPSQAASVSSSKCQHQIRKQAAVPKSGIIKVNLKNTDLAGLTKDQFIDLLSEAAPDPISRMRGDAISDDFDAGDHSSLDSEEMPKDNKEQSKSVGIAMRAAEEAKAASQAQNSAGIQAAREVKLQLAEKAQRAANAAQSALSEKQNEMHMLEEQMRDAETVVIEEHSSLNQTRQNVETAAKTVNTAKEQYEALEKAMKFSKLTIAAAEELAQGAQHELDEKVKLMNSAKTKVVELQHELERAKAEYINTRESAMKAMEAAKEASVNANQNN